MWFHSINPQPSLILAFNCLTRHKSALSQVKKALFDGGIARANKPEGVRNTPGIQKWEDLELIYAGQRMADSDQLAKYHVPPGCKCLIAIERAKLVLGKPDPDSAYWN